MSSIEALMRIAAFAAACVFLRTVVFAMLSWYDSQIENCSSDGLAQTCLDAGHDVQLVANSVVPHEEGRSCSFCA